MDELQTIKSLDYRGVHLEFKLDNCSQSIFTNIDGQEISLGSYNPDYEQDACYLVDYKLDHICSFDELSGTELTWFFNGNNQDICLKYGSRILKVFLVSDKEKVSENELSLLKKECITLLQKIKKNLLK